MNWIFNLRKSISKWIFAGYTGSKNPVRNRLNNQFIKLDFSKLIFQKSGTDQQGVYRLKNVEFVHCTNRGSSPQDLYTMFLTGPTM